jgi:predicted nuclease with TOPRIM domain
MSPTVDFQKEYNTLRNKQVEIFDRLGQLEAQITQFNERVRKLEEIVARLESNSQRRPPYQR